MGLTSLQVCMDSSDHWLQGTISEDGTGMESSSPITTPTGDEMLTCSRPLIERRLRPQHEQSLKCPRCDSTHTKFCYYNNYSLSQPRYFCKTCRRYWTKGGTLRNIPVGGGCRKNKKTSSKKSSSADNNNSHPHSPTSASPLGHAHPNAAMSSPISYGAAATDLQLAFSDQLHFASVHAAAGMYGTNPSYLLDHHAPIDFMDNKYEALLGGGGNFMNGEGYGGVMAAAPPNSGGFHGGYSSQFGMSDNGNNNNQMVLESCQRLMLPYDNNNHHQQQQNDVVEAKPSAKILSLEWHDHHQQQQACNSDAGIIKDSFGYSFGSWTGLMNGYGSSTNPLV